MLPTLLPCLQYSGDVSGTDTDDSHAAVPRQDLEEH